MRAIVHVKPEVSEGPQLLSALLFHQQVLGLGVGELGTLLVITPTPSRVNVTEKKVNMSNFLFIFFFEGLYLQENFI